MAEPVARHWNNHLFGAPAGDAGTVGGLPCHWDGQRCLAAFELTDDEIRAVVATGMVLVSTMGRPCPIAVTATMDV